MIDDCQLFFAQLIIDTLLIITPGRPCQRIGMKMLYNIKKFQPSVEEYMEEYYGKNIYVRKKRLRCLDFALSIALKSMGTKSVGGPSSSSSSS